MSRTSRVLPVAAVLAGLALAGCEHPDGLALVTVSATASIRTTSPADTPPVTTTADAATFAPGAATPDAPPVATTATGPPPPPAARTSVEPPTPAASTRTDVEIAEAKVVELTNAERAAHGCPALAPDDRLATAARAHSADMAAGNYFDHVSQDGRTFVDRVRAAGHPAPGAENIAAGQRTAEAVVKGWMASPGHRANILNCKLKTLGAGMARGGSYGLYWVQVFGW